MRVNELNINIKKALITDISLRLGDKGLEVDVTGSLLTESGKRVSSFSFRTNHWNDEDKLEVPFEINEPARRIFELLTPAIYKRIEGEFKQLSAGGKSKPAKQVDEDLAF